MQIKEYSVGEVWIFSGTTHSPSFCKTLWWRLTFTDFMPTTFKIDNKELKNTMEGECNPTGNNENSGIIRFQHSKKPKYHQPWKKVLYKKIKDFSIIPLQWAYTMKWGQVTFTWQDEKEPRISSFLRTVNVLIWAFLCAILCKLTGWTRYDGFIFGIPGRFVSSEPFDEEDNSLNPTPWPAILNF